MFELFLVLLLIFMITTALLALESEDLVSAVVLMGAVGFGLSVCFILVRAPEVALVQIVVEVIILIFLLRGTIGIEVKTDTGARDRSGLLPGIVLVGLFLVLSLSLTREFPEFGEPAFLRFSDSASWTYLKESLSLSGAGNSVSAILLDFRGYDSLGEIMVLFAGTLGALTLVRRRTRAEKPKEREK